MSLSASTAWDETAALAKSEARRIFPIAFLLLSLPSALLQAVAPAAAPGRLPEPGPWLLLVPAVAAAGLIGALTIARLALRPGERAGAAFMTALRRFPCLLGAALLFALAGMVVIVAALLLGAALGSPLPVAAAIALLAFFWVRLILLTPIAAAEPIGPIALILRGWGLSVGHFWRLLGFLLVAAILSLAALTAGGLVGGIAARLAAGQPQPGTFALVLVLLLSALLQAAVSGVFAAFLARLYAQLGGDPPDVPARRRRLDGLQA
jgi:hypothetical protein